MDPMPRWSQGTKQLVSAAILILAGLLVYSFRGILAPLVIALLIAYILSPVVGWLSKKLHVGRGWVAALVYLAGIALLATAPAITVSVVTSEVVNLWESLTAIINQGIDWLSQPHELDVLNYAFTFPGLALPEFSLDLERVINLIQGAISPLAGGAFSVIMTVASGVGWIFLVAMLSFYLLLDAERIGPALLRLVPSHYRSETSKLMTQLDQTWAKFLRGQLALCLVIGTLTALAASILGLRFAIALGIVAGILEIIPSIGPTLAAVPAILLALFQGAGNLPTSNFTAAIVVALVYWFIQILENNLLVPRIMGSTLKLRPLVIIVGVLGGATLGGVLGALLAAPILASLRDVLRYVYCKLADIDPFPAPPSFADLAREREVQAILFDLDGTLLDTDDVVVGRLASRLRRFSLGERLYKSERMARRLVMAAESPLNLMVTVLDLLHLDAKFFALSGWLRRAYGQREPERFAVIDGVATMIRRFNASYDLAIVTTRDHHDTARFLQEFELADCFKSVVTRQDVKRLKPHPEPVYRAAKELGIDPERCIVIGDTTVDIRAGKRAGALTVGVLCGFGERAELKRLEADLILGTTAELAHHLFNHHSLPGGALGGK